MQHLEALPMAPRPTRAAQLAALTRANVDDLLGGLGLGRVRRGRGVLARLATAPAQRFARSVIAYDDIVGQRGLAAGGDWATRQFAGGVDAVGAEHYPRHGPLLLVSNHPGLWDTTALFSVIERPDLRIIAAARPFLQALPNTARQLLFVDDSSASRVSALRAAARHLRGGGAVLTFGAGRIEPDPALMPGADQTIDAWSASVEAMARFVPELTIVPVIVSGVLSRAALRHPLTYVRRRRADREWLAALLQIQLRSLRGGRVRIAFGLPITARAHGATGVGAAVKAEALRLLRAVPRQR